MNPVNHIMLLADHLRCSHPDHYSEAHQALRAAELRRLHETNVQLSEQYDVAANEVARLRAENEMLLAALKAILSIDAHSALTEMDADEINAKARAAIAKAEGGAA